MNTKFSKMLRWYSRCCRMFLYIQTLFDKQKSTKSHLFIQNIEALGDDEGF